MNTRDEILQLAGQLRTAPLLSDAAKNIFRCIDVWERGQSSTATAGELRLSARTLTAQLGTAPGGLVTACMIAAISCLAHATAAFIMAREPLAIVLLERCRTHLNNAIGQVRS